ncbi:MAG: Ig-like domain-containing protein, partial [Actinomycetota bacterium]
MTVDGNIASASALSSEAHAFKDPTTSSSPERNADLQTVMANASGIPLPSDWNTRGYGRVVGFSALNGTIKADVLEGEAVFGTRTVGGTPSGISASGALVERLRLEGALGDPITGDPILLDVLPNTPNQVFNVGTIRIAFWETNWDPTTGTTTDGQPVFVTALRVTDSLTGADIAVGEARATGVYVAPAPPAAPGPNQPPNAVNDNANTTQGTSVDVDVTDNDTDSDGTIDNASVTITDQPDNGTLSCVNNICTYTPNAGFSGNDSFTYRVCDDDGACDTATVNITVAAAPAAPEAPVANDDTATTTEGTPVTIDVDGNDTDGDGNLDPSTVSITVPPAAGSGSVTCNNSGVCTFTPVAGFSGTATFTYRICDTTGLCDTATVTVTVAGIPAGPPPVPPAAVDDLAATDDQTQIVIPVLVNDVPGGAALDNTTLSVQVHPDPAQGSVICSAGQCTFTP